MVEACLSGPTTATEYDCRSAVVCSTDIYDFVNATVGHTWEWGFDEVDALIVDGVEEVDTLAGVVM